MSAKLYLKTLFYNTVEQILIICPGGNTACRVHMKALVYKYIYIYIYVQLAILIVVDL